MTNDEAVALFLKAISEVRERCDTPEHIEIRYPIWEALVNKSRLDIDTWTNKNSYQGIPVEVARREEAPLVRVSSKEDRLVVEELNLHVDRALRDTLFRPTRFILGSKIVERFQRHLGTTSVYFQGVLVEVDPFDARAIRPVLKEDPPQWCDLLIHVAQIQDDMVWGILTGIKGHFVFIRLEGEGDEITVSFGDLMRLWHKVPPRTLAKDRFRRVLSLDTVSDLVKR